MLRTLLVIVKRFYMKIALFPFCLLGTILFSSCDDKEQKRFVIPDFLDVKKIDCESTVELCNRKPGLKFTGFAPRVVQNKPDWDLSLRVEYYPDSYSLTICCDSIPRLIDSLSMMNEVLESFKNEKPERAEKTCQLADTVTITVIYVKDLAGTGEYSSLEFGKVSEGSVFFFHKPDAIKKLIEDINERFRTCCLG